MYGLRAIIVYHQSDDARATQLRRALGQYVIPPSALPDALDEPASRLGPISKISLSGDKLTREKALAIDAADTLIVLCSPAAAKSGAVDKAAEVFTSRLRGRRIIPVIHAGEPGASRMDGLQRTECLPRALRFAVDASGAITNHLTVPDYIDARVGHAGAARAEDVAVRVAARMLKAPYEPLRAHDRRRRRRRGFVIGAATAAGLAFLATLPVLYDDAQRAAQTKNARQIGIDVHQALDRGDANKAVSLLTSLFPKTFNFDDPPFEPPAEALSALSRTALETRVVAQLPAPVDKIKALRVLPGGALAAVADNGAAHLLDLGLGETTQVYAPKRGAIARISRDGGTLWTARFGPISKNDDGDIYAPLMFEDVDLATGDISLKTAVQSLPAQGAAAISPDGALFAVDAGPGDGERTLVAVFSRVEQALAGVTTLPSDQAQVTFLDDRRLLLSIDPPSPFGAAPGLYLWDVLTDQIKPLRRPGATPVCPGAQGMPRLAIAREITAGRMARADWTISESGGEVALLLPRVTGGSCILRWSAAGRALPSLVFGEQFDRIAFAHDGAFALVAGDAPLTIARAGGARHALTDCGANAEIFAGPDGADEEPVVFCPSKGGVTIHNGLSGQRYWRGPAAPDLTALAHDRPRQRLIGAGGDGRLMIWDAAPRGRAVDAAEDGLRLARAGETHVVALPETRPARFFDLTGQGLPPTDDLRASVASAATPTKVLALSTEIGLTSQSGNCADLPQTPTALTALSPSGERMAIETETGVTVFDLTTCQPLLRLPARSTGGGPLLPEEDRLWLPLPGEIAVFPMTLPPAEALGAIYARKMRE